MQIKQWRTEREKGKSFYKRELIVHIIALGLWAFTAIEVFDTFIH